MMNSETITVSEALERLKNGEKLEGLAIDFKRRKVKALDAFNLGKAGIDIPDEVIEYDDADIAFDPEFDDYEWERTTIDPLENIKEKLTVNLEIDKDINAWIQKNGIEIDHLLEELINNFYSANRLIRKK